LASEAKGHRFEPCRAYHLHLAAAIVVLALSGCGPPEAGAAQERNEERVRLDVPRLNVPRHDAPRQDAPREQPPLGLDTPAPKESRALHVVVECAAQQVSLLRGETVLHTWPVSTSRYGLGSRAGSNKTPLGRHRVAEKFGEGAPLGTVFRARRNTGQVAHIYRDGTDVEDDLVLTRVLWLEGLEPGRNQGAGVDSKERFIYLHGTNEEGLIGTPASHGCVRMRNRDVVELFALVPVGTPVTVRR
jgi:hypothetical protein